MTNLAAVADTVLFDATVFQGQQADTIVPLTPLPPITSPLNINSGTCLTEAAVNGPCAGVEGPSGNTVLTIEADGSSVSGLAITGGAIGIGVFGASTKFTATSNWIGLQLNGANGAPPAPASFSTPGLTKRRSAAAKPPRATSFPSIASGSTSKALPTRKCSATGSACRGTESISLPPARTSRSPI